jgi:cytochrome c-type biogenesis protein CcmH
MAMKPDDQQAMIHKMVDRLAAKMKDNPNDLDGWQRLARAYRVLGETDKAKEAESKAAALQAK